MAGRTTKAKKAATEAPTVTGRVSAGRIEALYHGVPKGGAVGFKSTSGSGRLEVTGNGTVPVAPRGAQHELWIEDKDGNVLTGKDHFKVG